MQTRKLIARALRQNFDAAVVIISHPSGDAEDVGFALDEPAETHALHASADAVTLGFNGFFCGVHACDREAKVKSQNAEVRIVGLSSNFYILTFAF